MAIKQKSSRSARRLVSGRKRQNKRRLSLESLENRRVLASFVVTTHLDTVDAGDGVTSLREAVSQANSTTAPDTITFDPSLNGTPITLSIDGSNENLNANGDIDISRDVTILGNGIDQTIISGGGDDGIDESVFNTLQNSNTIFQNLTIRDGRATSGLAAGGAIAAQTFASGSLLIESVRITGNQATNAGGGVIGADTSNITIVDSMIDDNAGGIGGGISTFGILDIVNTTIDNNRTTGGVGGGVQVQDDSAVATIRSSTISNNTAGFAGGALANVLGDLTVINTTISGNEAVSLGGAVFTVSNSGGSADTDIQFSTIADNASTNLSAGVVHTQSESDGSSVVTTLSNNILANNTGFASSANITFGDFDAPGDLTFTSEGGNVFDDGAFGINIASDQINVNQTIIDPILADNGGPVATHALVANSPAIDAAQTAGLSPPVMDSRGQLRDTALDSGAYELDTPSIRFDVNRPNAVEGLISEIQVQAIATAFDASDLRGAGNLSVDFTIAGENITSDDYSIASNSVTVDTSGATSNFIVGSALLTIQDDDLVEADESLSLTPDSADGGTLESLDAVSVNIVDNDRSAITLGDVIVGESDGTAIVPITLTNPVDIAVELNLRTVDNTAIAGTDFVGVANQTVTIPAGAVQANASVTISPNGIMDGDRDFTIEIDGINSAGRDIGGTLTRLDQPAAPTSRLGSFTITPEGQFAVYQNGGNLFQVPVSGGTATQLNAPLIPGGGIVDFQLSSDGSRVVYRAEQDTDNVFELYSVPIAGGTPTRISGNLVDGGIVIDFQLSSDGSRVVYTADQDTDNVFELYSVPIAGGTPVKLAPQSFDQSVTNESVLFRASDAGTAGLFVTPLAIESKITIVDDDVATDPVITWDMPESIVFGTAISATQLDATADVAGTFVYTPVAGTVLDAGLGQTLSVTFTPTDTTNFNVVTATTTIDVDRANPVVTWNNPADIQLGTALDDDQLNATADVAGTFVYTPVAGTVLEAGDGQTLSVAFTPTDIDNFTSATAEVTINVIGPNDPTIDFGDAPEGYPVTLADDGARHAVGTLRLGTLVDAELDGSNSQSSDGDGADEDGVTMLSTAIAQADQPTMTSVAVTASEAGKLDAWVDFNLNGSWEQGEQIFDSVDVVSGPNVLSVTIPAGAQAGLTVARFRISTAGDLEPTGAAADGEVEDHLFLIETANQNSVFVSSPFAGTTTIEFSGDDLVVRFGQTVLFQGPTDEIANLSIVGSSEDDIVVVDASVNAFEGVALDGLGGNDQLILAGSGQIIQSESLISVTGLEFVDLTGTGPNSLSLTEDQIAGLPDSGTTLRIQLDSDDTFTPILDQTNNANNAIELTGSGVDGDTFYVMAESEGATFELSGLNWTNPILRFDSNNSGSVTAADALVIINQLRSREFVIGDTMNLIDPAELQTTFPLAFFDPSADNRLTALDALQVINEIRRLNSAPVESELIASDVLRSARGSIGHSVSSEHSEHLEHQASALQASAVVKESATDTESSDEYAFDSFSQHTEATDEALVDIYATIGLLSDASAE